MRIATWNINSIRARLHLVERLAETVQPDVICLQETKVADELFPARELAAFGYPHQAIQGMKAYHGVAILSRTPLIDTGGLHWCGKTDARHVHATLPGGVELHNLYVPSGGDIPDPKKNEKFAHKLQFMSEQTTWWSERRNGDARCMLVGDLNVAPLETDVWSHKQLLNVVSHTPVEVEHFSRLQDSHDWVDAVRAFVPQDQKLYSWWSYRAKDWRASDRGRRLDHVWVTPSLRPALARIEVLKDARDWDKASDHVPVVVDIEA